MRPSTSDLSATVESIASWLYAWTEANKILPSPSRIAACWCKSATPSAKKNSLKLKPELLSSSLASTLFADTNSPYAPGVKEQNGTQQGAETMLSTSEAVNYEVPSLISSAIPYLLFKSTNVPGDDLGAENITSFQTLSQSLDCIKSDTPAVGVEMASTPRPSDVYALPIYWLVNQSFSRVELRIPVFASAMLAICCWSS